MPNETTRNSYKNQTAAISCGLQDHKLYIRLLVYDTYLPAKLPIAAAYFNKIIAAAKL